MKSAALWKVLLLVSLFITVRTVAQSPWEEPATDLSQKIASVVGACQARIAVNNTSSIPDQDLPGIKKLLEAKLKSHGVVPGGEESASAIRITLSENLTQRVWVAEIEQGSTSKAVMVLAGLLTSNTPRDQVSLLLQATPLLSPSGGSGLTDTGSVASQILSVMADATGIVVLQAEAVTLYTGNASVYAPAQTLPIVHRRSLPRDLRGRLVRHSQDGGFTAYLPGMECEVPLPSATAAEASPVLHCKDSDDPWPIVTGVSSEIATPEAAPKAFFNATGNFFTGVVTPAFSFELPAFYDAVPLPRATAAGLLVHELNGAVELIDGIARKPVRGARDWGSDFAVLRTKCSTDPIVLVSASGEAVSDSLRAYAIPGQEAVAVSAPLVVDGTVSAMAALSDSSAAVIVRKEDKLGSYHDEVLRVTTLCN